MPSDHEEPPDAAAGQHNCVVRPERAPTTFDRRAATCAGTTARVCAPSPATPTESAARVAQLLDEIVQARRDRGDGIATNEAIGKRVGVSEKRVREIRRGRAPLRVDALYLLPRSIAVELLHAMLADLETLPEQPPQHVDVHLRRMTAKAGEIARVADDALADGVLDDREKRAIALRTLDLTKQSLTLVRDLTRGDDEDEVR